MISLYPKLKYTDEMIEDIKNLNINKESAQEKKDTNENQIKEDFREDIKEKEDEKSNESEKENK